VLDFLPSTDVEPWSERIRFGKWKGRTWAFVLGADPFWIIEAVQRRQDDIPVEWQEELYDEASARLLDLDRCEASRDLFWDLHNDDEDGFSEEEALVGPDFRVVSHIPGGVYTVTDPSIEVATESENSPTSIPVPPFTILGHSLNGFAEKPTLRQSGDTLANVFVFFTLKASSDTPSTLQKSQVSLAVSNSAGMLLYVDSAFSVNGSDEIDIGPGDNYLQARFHVPSVLCRGFTTATSIALRIGACSLVAPISVAGFIKNVV
jgi:hypothetical protein